MKRVKLVGVFAIAASMLIGDAALADKIMIFGGADHKTYLGCLSCSQYETDSVFNDYGLYGNPYGVESIFNSYSEYGSPYSMYSACNEYATDPPVIVDEEGDFYGRLTINDYNSEQTNNQEILNWLKESVCKLND